MKKNTVVLLGLALLLLLGGQPTRAAQWPEKADPWVLQQFETQETVEFLVVFEKQADLRAAAALPRAARGAFVYQELTSLAEKAQAPVIADLDSLGVAYRPFWISNMIWVRGGVDTLTLLNRHPGIARFSANPAVPLRIETAGPSLEAVSGVEWNILLVQAPVLWALGLDGSGVVIGGQDTGYEWDHPGLVNQYRGWDGGSVDHAYNWHDAIHTDNLRCQGDSPIPCDDYGHGTLTMGVMVGDDGLGNQVGMAPGAAWIGCRNMDQGVGTPASYAECFQWFLAPTDLANQNPDPARAPHIINNSWSCPEEEGCTDPNILKNVVDHVRAAGILVVTSAGNDGPECSSLNNPTGIYDSVLTVGAVTAIDEIADYSNRGPVLVDGSNRLKPDVTAPGSGIRSTALGGGYAGSTGTSMAAPHVSGLAALLIQADPVTAGSPGWLTQLILGSALPKTTLQTCGELPGSQVPNHTYGYGRIDAQAAYLSLLEYGHRRFLPLIRQELP